MYRTAIALLILFITITSAAQDSSFKIHEFYPIDNGHSYIGFSVKYMGYAMVKGRFEKFKGTFRYDENDLSKTSVSLSIDAKSIDTDNGWRDKDLQSDNWFDVENFPHITFVSTKVKRHDPGFEINGNLTIKGVTKEVIIQMNKASGVLKDFRGDSQVIFTGETVIDRKDFGVEGEGWSAIKEGVMGVGNEIQIEVSILGKQINLPNYKNWVRNEAKPPGRIYKEISENGVEAGLSLFEELKTDPGIRLKSNALNSVGHVLLLEGKIDEALEVFQKNLETFPEESYLYGSYAKALVFFGNLTEAKTQYQKALDKNSNNQNSAEILRHMK